MPLWWMQGPSGGPFQVLVGLEGVSILNVAAKLHLNPRTVELNGILMMYDSSGMCADLDFLHCFGDSEDKPILVSGQSAAAATSAGLTKDDVQEAVERALKKQKHSSVSISAFSTEHWSYLSQAAGLSMRTCDTQGWVPDGVCVAAEPFCWSDEVEPAQASRCMSYLQDIIKVGSRTADPLIWLAAGSRSTSLLDTYGFESLLHYNKITGNADAAIITRASCDVGIPKDGMCVLFELKQQVTSQHVYHAACQLVLASLSSHFRPIVVLTDLREDWQLFWLDYKTVWAGKLASRGAALAVIQVCVDAAAEEAFGGNCESRSSRLSVCLPDVLAKRQTAALLGEASTVVSNIDAPLLSLADQLPAEDMHEVCARVMLHQLSMQPSFCGLDEAAAMHTMYS